MIELVVAGAGAFLFIGMVEVVAAIAIAKMRGRW